MQYKKVKRNFVPNSGEWEWKRMAESNKMSYVYTSPGTSMRETYCKFLTWTRTYYGMGHVLRVEQQEC